MQFHQTQAIVAKDNTQYRIVDCGRQWGKTTLACWEMFGCAVAQKGRRIGYFATTFGQARDIAWRYLKEITQPIWAKEPNETRLELFVRTQDGGVSELVLKGWESIETNRGTQFDLIVLDEVSKMRNFKEGWQGVLLGTLAFRQGKALMISTPYGFNHFNELYELGQGRNALYKSWKFSSYDNPHLSREYLEGIRTTSTEDFFAQEYMAEFRRFTGLIYQEFDMPTHVHYFDTPFAEHGDYYFGQDFGVRGFNASVVIRVDDNGDFWILDCYKEEGKTASDSAEEIKKMLKRYQDLEKYTGYADPAGWANNLGSIVTGQVENKKMADMQWAIADEFIEAGLPITPANNKVVSGINYVRQLFKANKIHIHSRCSKLIDELIQYQWKEIPSTQEGEVDNPEKVRKINDHLVDALRYALYSKPMAADPYEKPRRSSLAIQFPPPQIEKEETDGLTPLEIPSVYD
jgi:hypothetical protein